MGKASRSESPPLEVGAWNEVTISQMVGILSEAMESDFGVSFIIHGPPAVGKSQGVQQATAAKGRSLIDDRLAQKDPTDIRGVLCPTPDGSQARWLIPPEYEPLFDEKSTHVLFGDEFNHSSEMVQKAAFEIALDHQIGGRKFGKKVMVILAGNREVDGCNVIPLEKPLQTRLIHLYVRFDFQTFFGYAMTAGGFHPAVLGYLKDRPDMAYKISQKATDYYGEPTPRTWEFVSKALRSFGPLTRDKVIAGALGPGAAMEFLSWVETAGTLTPIIDAVLAGKNETADNLSKQFFVCQSVVERFRTDRKLAKRLLDYVLFLQTNWGEIGAMTIQSAHAFGSVDLKGCSNWSQALRAYSRILA